MNHRLKSVLSGATATWAAIALASFAFLAFGIDREGIGLDEAFSAAMAQHGYRDIALYTARDVHPPLYYLILETFSRAFGNEAISLRMVSVVGAVALILLAAGPVRSLFGKPVAHVFALLSTLAPITLHTAHEARMYTWANCFTTGGVLYALLAVRRNGWRDWALFGVFTLAGAYTHYFSLVALSVCHLLVFAHLALEGRGKIRRHAITAGAVLVGYGPWLAVLGQQVSRVSEGFWVPPLRLNTILRSLLVPFEFKNSFGPVPTLPVIALVISAACIVAGLFLHVRDRDSEGAGAIRFLLLVYSLTFASVAAFSLWVVPVLVPKYMSACAGIYLLAVAMAVAKLPNAWLRHGSLLALCTAMLVADFSIQTRLFNGPSRQMAALLREKLSPGEVILHDSIQTLAPLWYYFPEQRHALVLGSEPVWFDPTMYGATVSAIDDLSKLAERSPAVWLVSRRGGNPPRTAEALRSLRYHEGEQLDARDPARPRQGNTATHYRRDGAAEHSGVAPVEGRRVSTGLPSALRRPTDGDRSSIVP